MAVVRKQAMVALRLRRPSPSSHAPSGQELELCRRAGSSIGRQVTPVKTGTKSSQTPPQLLCDLEPLKVQYRLMC